MESVHQGIYQVIGAVSIPTQVVVTSKLPVGEYGPFKALAKGATKEDIIRLLELAGSENPQMVEYVRAVLRVSTVINMSVMTEIKEAGIMPEAVYEVFREEFQKERDEGRAEGEAKGRAEGEAKGRAKGRSEGTLITLAELVQDGLLSEDTAAKKANLSVDEFRREVMAL